MHDKRRMNMGLAKMIGEDVGHLGIGSNKIPMILSLYNSF
jgi:hypothetical protein